MSEKEIIIKKLKEIENKPGGNLAIRFIIDSLGGYSFYASTNTHEDRIEKTIEKLEESNANLSEILQILESELTKSNKANFSILLGEVLGLEIPFMIKSGYSLKASAILNSESVAEFKKYEDLGWIILSPNDDFNTNTPIIDKKRNWGNKSRFVIIITESYYS